MTAMNLGHMVCCGTAFPIDRIELTGGEIVLSGEREGRLRAGSGPCSIYGEDGSVILAEGAWLSWEKIGWLGTFRWRYTLEVNDAVPAAPGNPPESRNEVPAGRQGKMKAITA